MTSPNSNSNSPPVKLHELTPPRITLQCTDGCRTLTRVYRTEPNVAIGAFKFCPVCGSPVLGYMSADTNGWEALSSAYNFPIPLLKQLHATWDSTKHKYLADHIAEVMQAARKINDA